MNAFLLQPRAVVIASRITAISLHRQHGNIHVVSHGGHGLAQQQVQQAAVAMRAHHQQVRVRSLDDRPR